MQDYNKYDSLSCSILRLHTQVLAQIARRLQNERSLVRDPVMSALSAVPVTKLRPVNTQLLSALRKLRGDALSAQDSFWSDRYELSKTAAGIIRQRIGPGADPGTDELLTFALDTMQR